jgi:anti-sigma B factor antagonist
VARARGLKNTDPVNIQVWPRDDWDLVELFGSLDMASAPRVRLEVHALLHSGRRKLLLDLRGIDFLDSTGLGLIVALRKRARTLDGELEIVVDSPRLRRIFEITDLDKAFVLYATPEALLASPPA